MKGPPVRQNRLRMRRKRLEGEPFHPVREGQREGRAPKFRLCRQR
jgi:hypothetical protein